MYKDQYLEYLKTVPDAVQFCIQKKKRVAFAYASNLDVLIRWDVEGFNRLAAEFLREAPSFRSGEAVGSMEDCARILSYFVIHGYGGEVDIVSGEVAELLPKYFGVDYGLGGTCAQGAAALGALGFPVLAHLTDCSGEVIDRMAPGQIETVKDGTAVPVAEAVSGEKPRMHFIVQFNKGDVVKVMDREYVVPLSNRLILDFDQLHKIMPVSEDFLHYCEGSAQRLCSYGISGFNGIQDMGVIRERLDCLTRHYAAVKQANPHCRIYFESAHYINDQVRDYIYRVLPEYTDIMGMNEEEFADLAKKAGCPADTGSIVSILEGLEHLFKIYPWKGIAMHSKDYALYYGDDMPDVDLEMGLTLGNLVSGTRARTGRYASLEDCAESLSLPLSGAGLGFAQKLAQLTPRRKALLVPSRYMEKPRTTIGLGDSFVAGMQMCFIK